MKKLLLICSLFSIVFSSCSKDDDKGSPSNGWKLGATTYNAAFVARIGSTTLSAMDAIPSGGSPSVNTLNVWFNALPTSGGTYRVVSYGGGMSLAANEIGVSAGLFATSTTYVSTGSGAVDATVSVSGGKITVSIPEIWVKKTTADDSLKLSGTIVEQ